AKIAAKVTRKTHDAGIQNAMPSFVFARLCMMPASTSWNVVDSSAASRTMVGESRRLARDSPGSSSGMADGRVEDRVEKVRSEVGEDVPDSDDEYQALHDEVLAAADGIDESQAHARKAEQILDDDSAANERTDVDAGDREQRERRRAERVANQDAPGRQTL